MSDLSRFLDYGRAFEVAVLTDDFSRIEPFFAQGATHRVETTGVFAADDHGRDAVVGGLRDSVQRIDRRFEAMLEQGLVTEVETLVARGDLRPDMPSMRSVGYRQVWEWLRGECDRADMVARGQAATRQLAKRQFTWLRSESQTVWLEPGGDELEQALRVIDAGNSAAAPA